ncbi:unnamed protein product [Gadus morhua 'NCC']
MAVSQYQVSLRELGTRGLGSSHLSSPDFNFQSTSEDRSRLRNSSGIDDITTSARLLTVLRPHQIEKMQRPGRLEGVHHLQPSQRPRRWPSANRVCVLWLRASLGRAPLIPPHPPG